MYDPGINTIYPLMCKPMNRNSNVRLLIGSNYINFVGASSTGTSISITCSTALNLLDIVGYQ